LCIPASDPRLAKHDSAAVPQFPAQDRGEHAHRDQGATGRRELFRWQEGASGIASRFRRTPGPGRKCQGNRLRSGVHLPPPPAKTLPHMNSPGVPFFASGSPAAKWRATPEAGRRLSPLREEDASPFPELDGVSDVAAQGGIRYGTVECRLQAVGTVERRATGLPGRRSPPGSWWRLPYEVET
jgi:hypothetical protein